jgi:hypothetical protein
MSCGCGSVQTGGFRGGNMVGDLVNAPLSLVSKAKSQGQKIVNYNASKMNMMPTSASVGNQVGQLTDKTGSFFSSAKHLFGMAGGNGSCGASAYPLKQDGGARGGRRGGKTRKAGKTRGGKKGGFHHGRAHTQKKGGRKAGGRKAGGRK